MLEQGNDKEEGVGVSDEQVTEDLNELTDQERYKMFAPPVSYCITHKKENCACKGRAAGRKSAAIRTGWSHFDAEAMSNQVICDGEHLPLNKL